MSSTEAPTDKSIVETAADSSEAKSATQPAQKKPADSKAKKPSNKSRSGLLWLVIILLLATSGGAYYYWQQLQKTIQKLSTSNEFQTNKLAMVADKLEQARKDLHDQQQLILQLGENSAKQNDQLKSMDDAQQVLLNTAKNVFDISHRSQSQWLLSEVSYLLSLANQRLLVSSDIRTAVAALKAANNRLHDLADPSLLLLRKKIADEIAQLNLIKLADINGIAFSLDNMTILVAQLPFKSAQQQHLEKKRNTESVELGSLEKDSMLAPLWERLKTLISIKKHSRDIQPTETVIEKQDIDNQLRYRIEAARLALINKNTAVFNHEIKSALDLVTAYYDQKDNRVATLMTELSSYSSLNLLPKFPDITGSWVMLQKLIAIDDAAKSLTKDSPKKNKGISIK